MNKVALIHFYDFEEKNVTIKKNQNPQTHFIFQTLIKQKYLSSIGHYIDIQCNKANTYLDPLPQVSNQRAFEQKMSKLRKDIVKYCNGNEKLSN